MQRHWQTMARDAHVCVLTAQSLLQALTSREWGLRDTGLLLLDDCHQVTSVRPLVQATSSCLAAGKIIRWKQSCIPRTSRRRSPIGRASLACRLSQSRAIGCDSAGCTAHLNAFSEQIHELERRLMSRVRFCCVCVSITRHAIAGIHVWSGQRAAQLPSAVRADSRVRRWKSSSFRASRQPHASEQQQLGKQQRRCDGCIRRSNAIGV